MTDWTDVDKAGDFGPGEVRIVDVDGVDVLVANVDGEYHAIENLCTHEEESFCQPGEEKTCLHGDRIICPRHEAEFSVKTGDALTPPAYEPAPVFPVRVENGVVQVRDDRWD
ncbi:MAG: ferredoxin [Gammaproteobacteria bacterium]|nr:MAG: ferredoxin [Gammaproteobacteria bacterium]RTZ62039.1 MAG: ferredoxin [Gammaproteobacteria bacterium]